MAELDQILAAWRESGPDSGGVLATVVHVKGSAYRRPGARMLILPDGRRFGSISGGCLEGEISQKAWWYTRSGPPVVRANDTSSSDDAVWEFGLGCNGMVHVLLERLDTAEAKETLAFLEAQRAAGQSAVIATVIGVKGGAGATACPSPQTGDRLLVSPDSTRGPLAGTAIASQLRPAIDTVLHERKSRLVHIESCDVFVEWAGPPLSVVVFGAGHDVIPFSNMAAQMGWSLTIADGRPAYANPQRFPQAKVVLMNSADLLRKIPIDPDTAVVMMTHNYPLDQRLLPAILEHRPFYLGMLGPRSRTEKLFAEIGAVPPAGLHAPIGLDIGSDTPAAIAVSIAAEIQAVLNSRTGGKLKYRDTAIHEAPAESGEQHTGQLVDAVQPEFCETVVGNA